MDTVQKTTTVVTQTVIQIPTITAVNFYLLLLVLLGVFLNNLMKLNTINRANNGVLNLKSYIAVEKISIIISLVGAVLYSLLLTSEILTGVVAKMPKVQMLVGVLSVSAGYLMQSILIKLFGKADKKVTDILG